jgi:glycerate dehydrogenase
LKTPAIAEAVIANDHDVEDIVFLDRSTVRAPLRAPAFAHRWTNYANTKPEEVVQRCLNASIVVANKVALRAHVLGQLPQLRMIAIPATGMDHVDLAWCRLHGVHVANCPDYSVHSVPEHAFGMMMAMRRNLLPYQRDLAAGLWQKSKNFYLFTHPVRDLFGETLGIIGRGSLGRATARLAEGFGMQVIYAEARGAKTLREGYTPFDDLLRRSDIVSLHCPLTPETTNLIGHRELALMKPDALLINTARGGLIDEDALLDALRTGRIGGAGLDVLAHEPPSEGSPLLEAALPNLLITPHVAWISDSAVALLAESLVAAIERFVQETSTIEHGGL